MFTIRLLKTILPQFVVTSFYNCLLWNIHLSCQCEACFSCTNSTGYLSTKITDISMLPIFCGHNSQISISYRYNEIRYRPISTLQFAYCVSVKYFMFGVNNHVNNKRAFGKIVIMTKIRDSETFAFKYFLSCCAATISESGKIFVVCESVSQWLCPRKSSWAQFAVSLSPRLTLHISYWNNSAFMFMSLFRLLFHENAFLQGSCMRRSWIQGWPWQILDF